MTRDERGDEPFIEAVDVGKSYPGVDGQVDVLAGLDLTVEPGEVITVVGVSGTGKSTLLNLLGGIDRPSAGRLRVGDRKIETLSVSDLTAYRRDTVGFVFQFYNLIPSFTALENVLTSLEAAGGFDDDDRGRAVDLLEAVGLSGKGDKFPEQLSGGEQQRVAIARALVKRPPLILADEPTGNLDETTGKRVLELLVEQARSTGACLVIVTHDAEIGELTDRTLRLAAGSLKPIEGGAGA